MSRPWIAAQRLIAQSASLTLASASLRVSELEEERGELDWATQLADLAFQQLDKLEQEDVSSEQFERGPGLGSLDPRRGDGVVLVGDDVRRLCQRPAHTVETGQFETVRWYLEDHEWLWAVPAEKQDQ